jgi:hypothetical protein
MGENKISRTGIITALFLCLVATVGALFTNGRMIDDYDGVWLVTFGGSLLTLSGAMVDFDPKRLIK